MTSGNTEFAVKEIEVPVPWGHISGKAWGKETDFPVVVLHGVMDNCGSFDRLIPMLPRSLYYICLDLPSHGKSSHFHDGLPLNFFNFIVGIRLVVEHLKLSRFYMMGHSLGAQMCIFYSSLYPEHVVKIVCLDGIIPEPTPVEKTVIRLRKRVDNIYDGVKGKTPPSYSKEEALQRLLKNRHSPLTEEAARVMIKRSLVPYSTGYRFSSDHRLKGFWRVPLTLEQIQAVVVNIQCPLLLIVAKETYSKYEPIYGENYIERLETLLYSAIDIRIISVEGNHDVHLNNPERVFTHVSSFLLELKSKL